jgi:hypothetical protein
MSRAGPRPLGELAAATRSVIAMLRDAMQRPPRELTAEVDDAERQVVAIRDSLIAALRARDGQSRQVRDALDRVNAALSLIVGVEYPATAIQRSMLDGACDALERLVEDGLLAA